MTIEKTMEMFREMATKGEKKFTENPELAQKFNEESSQMADWLEELIELRQWKENLEDKVMQHADNYLTESVRGIYKSAIRDVVWQVKQYNLDYRTGGKAAARFAEVAKKLGRFDEF